MSRIKRLEIKNCLGIKELEFNPGKVNLIKGGNERGKTSILEVIEKALYNSERRARFVRAGEDQAYIELTTDDGLKIQRVIGADGDASIKVTLNWHPLGSPETYLKDLFGSQKPGKKKREVFAFNPVDFMGKKDAEQTDILLSLLPISFTQNDAESLFEHAGAPPVDYSKHGLQVLKDLEKYWYDARREANSAVKHTKYEVEAVESRLPDNYCVENWENVSLAELYGEIQAAQKVNTSRENAQRFIDDFARNEEGINSKYALEVKEAEDYRDFKLQKEREGIDKQKQSIRDRMKGYDDKIAELEKQIAQLVFDKKTAQVELDNLETMSMAGKEEALNRELAAKVEAINANKQKDLTALADRKQQAIAFLEVNPAIDLEPLEHKAKHSEEMKNYIPLAKELAGIRLRLQNQEATADLYNMYVDLCRSKPAELLANVDLPLEGLGIDESGYITINDLPLRNLSTSKQVRICLDIARAYAKDNPLKLICVDKLEHLDETTRSEFLTQIENDGDWQYFITQVTDGDLNIDVRGDL